MEYKDIVLAKFIDRPNRFIGVAETDGGIYNVHIKNTGRCRELFKKGVNVVLERSNNPNRKTGYTLIGVYKGEKLINIDSTAPNYVAYEAIAKGAIPEIGIPYVLKREAAFGKSRLDLYFETGERKGYIEVKGVTLENEKVASFPDAPTVRGSKHIRELISAKDTGMEAYILFVIQMKGVTLFTPNEKTDRVFKECLDMAYLKGVGILVYDCMVTPKNIYLDKPVPYTNIG